MKNLLFCMPVRLCNKRFYKSKDLEEMFYLNSTLNFGIPPVLVFQLEVFYMVDRLLTGLTARGYSNKTSLDYLN